MNETLVNKILELAGDFVKNANSLAPEVVKEVCNYFIFLAGLAIIKNLMFGLLLGLFFRFMSTQIRYLNAEKENYKDESVKRQLLSTTLVYATIRNLVCIGGAIAILTLSYPSIETIGKATIAPKLFILEKAKELSGK